MKTKVLLFALLALAATPALALLQVGQAAPDWSLPDTAWVSHRLADFRGQVVLLNFWMEF